MEKKTLYRYFGNCATEEERIQVLEWTKASPENLKEFCRERNIYNAILLSTDNSISQFGRTMKHKSLYLFYIKNKSFLLKHI